MIKRVDVAVIGAGPAGTTAATLLARTGRQVELFDRARFPRDKCCGDGLTTLALRELAALGLDPSAVKSWHIVDRVVVRSPAGREIRYQLPDGPGYHAAVARREDLDTVLVEMSQKAGATLHENVGLTDARSTVDGVILGFGARREPMIARVVIAADGMWSSTRKALGLAVDGYRGDWHAFRQYYRKVSRRAAHELVVWFEPDLLPGYAWSFPLGDGRANVGFGIQRQKHRVSDMNRTWKDLTARSHVREMLGESAEPESPHRSWPIPAALGRLPLTAPRTMFVGDAGGVTDPMTGEGIAQALVTGRLAAEVVMAHSEPDDAVRDYERRARMELTADDRMARGLSWLLSHARIVEACLKATCATPWLRRNFVRWMFEDYPRAIAATPRRWQRGALSDRGVFANTEPSLHKPVTSGR